MGVHPAALTKLPNFDPQVNLGLVDCKLFFVSLCKNGLDREMTLNTLQTGVLTSDLRHSMDCCSSKGKTDIFC